MTVTVTLKCPHCGATETKKGAFKNLSSLNTHINVHCNENPKNKVGNEDPEHTHKFKLLKAISPAHERAIEDGYTKICECGEII